MTVIKFSKSLKDNTMNKMLLIATALTIIISSCNQKKDVTSTIIIAGNLKNYDASEIRVFKVIHDEYGISSGYIFFEEDDFKITSGTAKEGDFKITFDAEAAEIYEVSIMLGESIQVAWDDPDKEKYMAFRMKSNERSFFELFLSPGDSIYLTADYLEPHAGFKVSGNRVAENTYLFEKRKLLGSIRNELMGNKSSLDAIGNGGTKNWMPFMGLKREEYFYKKDSLFNVFKSSFEVLKANNAIDPEFVLLEEAYFQYQPLVLDLDYPFNHARINRGVDETPRQVFERISSGNMDGIDFPIDKVNADLAKVDLTRVDLLTSQPYTFLIKRRVNDVRSEMMKQDTTLKNNAEGLLKAKILTIDRLPIDQLIKDHLLYSTITIALTIGGPSDANPVYEKFMNEHQSPELAAKLHKKYEKWDPILPGKEVPDFTFVNMEGDSVKLSGLRGTLVYIDIWATWCGPCIAEHPHWDKLREEYKDKPVSFLTISVDTKKELWEKMVKAKNMEGLQWYAADAFKSELATHFMVDAIPRFILLDREGKIIDPAADRPRGNIRAILDQHL
jgi:thiol-disulfide isomerase/thioredoxin